MKDKFTRTQIAVYWLFIITAPFSLLTVTFNSPPIFVWLAGSLALISSINRFYFEQRLSLKGLAGIAVLIYGGALGLLFYNYILDL